MKSLKSKSHDDEELIVAAQQSKYFETYVHLSNKSRIIFMNEDFTKEAASAMAAWLLYYDHQSATDDITIYINSDGGDASALACIYDVMQMIDAPIQTVAIGKAYSAGAVLLAAGTAGKRYIMPHAEVMIHKVQVGFPMLNKTEIDQTSYLKFLDSINENILKILSKHTKQPIAKIKEDFLNTHDLFLDAKQAVEYGLADRII